MKRFPFIPLYDLVFIKRAGDVKKQTTGGIVIPESAQEKPIHGTVVATGHGKTTMDGHILPLTVQVGDEVWFDRYAGNEYIVEGEEYLVMTEDQLKGYVRR